MHLVTYGLGRRQYESDINRRYYRLRWNRWMTLTVTYLPSQCDENHFLKVRFLLFFSMQTHHMLRHTQRGRQAGGDIDTRATFKGPSADIAKVSPALILSDFIHAKVISDSPNGGGDGCGGSSSRKAVGEPGKPCVCHFGCISHQCRTVTHRWGASCWRSLPVPGKLLLSLCFQEVKAAAVK